MTVTVKQSQNRRTIGARGGHVRGWDSISTLPRVTRAVAGGLPVLNIPPGPDSILWATLHVGELVRLKCPGAEGEGGAFL